MAWKSTVTENSYIIKLKNKFKTSVLSVGLAYSVIVTLRVSKGRKILIVFLIFHLAVLHLFFNNGLKQIPVDCVKSLQRAIGSQRRRNHK